MQIRLGAIPRWKLVFILALCCLPLGTVAGVCELSIVEGRNLYNYSLASPSPENPHGVLSEDGFYKIVVNDTSMWFQLCSHMLFNHDPPRCLECEDCGGPSHCGMNCSALVSNYVQGYPVCTAIGQASTLDVELIDRRNPGKGVTVKMWSVGLKKNCSLSVSIICNKNGAEEPEFVEVQGLCDYEVVLRHPSGCPKIIPINGNGLGSFGTLLIIILCLMGAYFSVGIIYRFFFLRVRGANVLPNLEFWVSVPQRLRGFAAPLRRRLRGQRRGSQSSYAAMNF